MIQSIVILERSGVSISDYLEMLTPSFSGGLSDEFQRQGMAIFNDSFGDTEASLGVWAAAIHHFVEGLAEDGVELPVARAISDLLNKAVEAGYGDEELAAVIKVLR